MRYGIGYLIIAMLLIAIVRNNGGWLYLLLWPALSFAIVGLAYFFLGPRVYGKSQRGLLSPIHQIVLLPQLMYAWLVWHIVRRARRQPAFNQLTDNIFIGRRLLSHELPGDIEHVIDLTCEFNEPKALRALSYYSFPILDGFVPKAEQLQQWTERAAGLSGRIYIHCAQGFGRTGLFAAALLLHIGHSRTIDEVLQFIKSKRPLVGLSRRQRTVLQSAIGFE